jgi:hypothetical protein
VAFTPDSRWLITRAGQPGGEVLRVWDVAPDERPVEDLRKLASLLSAQSWGPSGTERFMGPAQYRKLWRELAARYPAEFTLGGSGARDVAAGPGAK